MSTGSGSSSVWVAGGAPFSWCPSCPSNGSQDVRTPADTFEKTFRAEHLNQTIAANGPGLAGIEGMLTLSGWSKERMGSTDPIAASSLSETEMPFPTTRS